MKVSKEKGCAVMSDSASAARTPIRGSVISESEPRLLPMPWPETEEHTGRGFLIVYGK